jgi:hypothetical protein
MKVICIDNSNKPNEIPISQWLVLKQEYTVIGLKRSIITGEQFFVLSEITPPAPYGGYKISRFGVDITKLNELIENKVLEEELI